MVGKQSMQANSLWHKVLAVLCSLTLAMSLALPNATALAKTNQAAGQESVGAAQEADSDQANEAVEQADSEQAASSASGGENSASDTQAGQAVNTTEAKQALTDDADVWDGTTHDVSWYDANKTEFTLTTAAQLVGLADITSPKDDYEGWQTGSRASRAEGITQDNFQGKTIKLGKNINLNNKRFDPISDFNNWGGGGQGTSNGTYAQVAWKGTFDGQGYTISGLNVDGSVNCATNYDGYQGLICAIGKGGVVKTLGVEGSVVARVGGGIVGVSNTDESSETSATLTMTKAEWPKIMNCWADVDIEGNGSGSRGCGGIFGGESDYRNCVDIVNCYALGNVSNGTIGTAGGIAGHQNGILSGCFYTGRASGGYDAGLVACSYQYKTDSYKGIGFIGSNNMAQQNSSASGNVYRVAETSGGNPKAYTTPFYTADQIKAGAATLGAGYVANSSTGYPQLFWQADSAATYTSISTATIASIDDQPYTGNAIEPAITVTLNGKTLKENEDYYVMYDNNVNPGTSTAKATAYGIGRYEGQTTSQTFSITQTSLANATIADIDTTWAYGTTEPAEPALTVTAEDGSTVLKKGVDYNVTYTNNTATGTATAIIEGANPSVIGTNSKTFKVIGAAGSVKGTGTAADPYQIGSKGEWQFVSHKIATGDENYLNGDIKITADFSIAAEGDGDLHADPLGYVNKIYGTNAETGKATTTYYNYYYGGNFDGDGHTITIGWKKGEGYLGNTYNEDGSIKYNGSSDYSALILYAGPSWTGSSSSPQYNTPENHTQTIQNITVAGSSATTKAAGIVYQSYGTTLTFKNCTNKAAIGDDAADAVTTQAAGIAANITGPVQFENCKNEGTIKNLASFSSGGSGAAGIIAYQYGATESATAPWNLTMTNCSNTGSISGGEVGGLINYVYALASYEANLKNCFNTGNITNTQANYNAYAGGLIANSSFTNNDYSVVFNIDSCYNSGNVSTPNATNTSWSGATIQGGSAGGIAGEASGYANWNLISCYNTGNISGCIQEGATQNANYGAGGLVGSYVGGAKAKASSLNILGGYNAGTITAGAYENTSKGVSGSVAGALVGVCKSTKTGGLTLNMEAGYKTVEGLNALGVDETIDTSPRTINDKTQSYSEDALKALPTEKLGPSFVKDDGATQINNGLPVLYWQKDVTQTSIANATIGKVADQEYTGSKLEPTIENVVVDGKTLVQGRDFTVEYVDNTNVGTARATLTGAGIYTGTTSVAFKVVQQNLSSAEIKHIADVWAAKSIPAKPELSVTSKAGVALVEGSDFTVAYTNNAATGEATATITGTGNYTGANSVLFNVECTTVDGLTGAGTEQSPYEISSKDELEYAALAINNNVAGFANATYSVTANIDATNSDSRLAVDSIGTQNAKFAATFDGGSKTITVSQPVFGYVDGGTISNVVTAGTLETTEAGSFAALVANASGSTTVSGCTNNATVTGNNGKDGTYVAGFIGQVEGPAAATSEDEVVVPTVVTIKDCKNEGAIASGDSSNTGYAGGIVGYVLNGATVNVSLCYNNAAVTGAFKGTYSAAGGIIGRVGASTTTANNIKVYKCANTGDLDSMSAGGIIGTVLPSKIQSVVTVSDVYNTGEVNARSINNLTNYYCGAGGIVGMFQYSSSNTGAKATISNAYNAGSIKLTNSSKKGVKAGSILGAANTKSDVTITNCYWLTGTASSSVGGKISSTVTDKSTSATDTELKATGDGGMASKLGVAFLDDTKSVNKGYPVLNPEAVKFNVDTISAQEYTSQEIKPEVNVYAGSSTTPLTEGIDYELTFTNNTNIGTANVAVQGIGIYSESSANATFEITKGKITDSWVDSVETQLYAGSAVEPALTVKNAAGVELVKGTDYTVTYANNNAAGTATFTVTGMGNYEGTATGTFEIVSKTLDGANVTASSVYYTGSDVSEAAKAAITVLDKDANKLTEGVDYKVSFKDAEGKDVSEIVEKGTYTATLTGIGAYAGSAATTFEVKTYLTIYEEADGGARKQVAEYTQAQVEALAEADASPVSALYIKKDVWNVSTAKSYVKLADLFADANLGDAYSYDGTTVEFGSGSFTNEQSATELESGKFYGKTTASAIDSTLDGTEVPAVLALEEASSAIESGKTAIEAQSANVAAASTANTPRILSGAQEAQYKENNVAGKRLVSNVDSITIKYRNPSIFKLQVLYKGSEEPTVLKEYNASELWKLKSEGEPVSGMFYKSNMWRVSSTSEYVTLADLFKDAGASDVWKSGANLIYGGDDPASPGKAAQTISYDTIASQCYFFPNASGPDSNDPDTTSPAPAVLSLTENSCSTGSGETLTAADAQTYNIKNKNENTMPRILYGISKEMYQNKEAAGMRYWSCCSYLTIQADSTGPTSIADGKATIEDVEYTGSNLLDTISSALKVETKDGKTLENGSAYTVKFMDATGAEVTDITQLGTYTAEITGIGVYTGTLKTTFNVVSANTQAITDAISAANSAIANAYISTDGKDVPSNKGWTTQVNLDTLNAAIAAAQATAAKTPLTKADVDAAASTLNAAVAAFESALVPGLGTNVMRLAGNDQTQTSAAISAEAFPNGAKTVVLCKDDDFKDAMSATGLAGIWNAPILLTSSTELSQAASDEIQRLGAEKVVIIGGEGAIKAAVQTAAEQLVGQGKVERVFGNGAEDTSVECAKRLVTEKKAAGESDFSKAIVSMCDNFQDALSISSFAYAYHIPILLESSAETADGRALTADAISLLTAGDFANAKVFVPGGTGAIAKDSVEGKVGENRVTRLAGESGYDTSNVIAEWLTTNGDKEGEPYMSASTAVVANGGLSTNGVDALSGSALAGKNKSVVLLVNTNPNIEATNLFTINGYFFDSRANIETAYVLGGTAVVNTSLEQRLARLID